MERGGGTKYTEKTLEHVRRQRKLLLKTNKTNTEKESIQLGDPQIVVNLIYQSQRQIAGYRWEGSEMLLLL